MKVQRIYRVIFKKPKITLLITAITISLCFLISAIASNLLPYMAKAKVMVSINVDYGAENDKVLNYKYVNRDIYSIAEIIDTNSFAKEIVEQLHLESFFGEKNAVSKLRSMVKAKVIPGTDILEITVVSQKPELAAQIANTACKILIKDSLEERFSFEKDMVEWFQSRAKGVREELYAAQDKLLAFNKESGVVDIETEYKDAKNHLTELDEKVRALEQSKSEAEIAFLAIQKLLESGVKSDELPDVLSDEEHAMLKQQYRNNQMQIDGLSEKYLSGHPQIKELIDDNKRIDASMKARIELIINKSKLQYDVLLSKLENQRRLVKAQQDKIGLLDEKLNEYSVYRDNLKEKINIYTAFVNKIDTYLAPSIRSEQISLIDQAYIPDQRMQLPAWLVTIIGIFVGLTISALYNNADRTNIRERQERRSDSEKPVQKGMYIERVKEDS